MKYNSPMRTTTAARKTNVAIISTGKVGDDDDDDCGSIIVRNASTLSVNRLVAFWVDSNEDKTEDGKEPCNTWTNAFIIQRDEMKIGSELVGAETDAPKKSNTLPVLVSYC